MYLIRGLEVKRMTDELKSHVCDGMEIEDVRYCPYCGKRLDPAHVETEECWDD